MASREARRISERLAGKKDAKEGGKKKFNFLTIPTFVIIGLVLVGLLWWGNSGSRMLGQVTFGQYDGIPIAWASGNYFARKVADVMQINNMEAEEAIRMLMPYMIFHTAALQEAERSGIAVCDREVEEYIVRIGAKEAYNRVDSVERHSLFELYREELLEVKVLQTMILSMDNQSLQQFGASMGVVEKKFRLVQWLYDEYPVQEVIAFATENPDQFRRIKLSKLIAQSEQDAKDAHDKIVNKQSTFDEQLALLSAAQPEGTAALDWQLFYLLSEDVGDPEAAKKIFALKEGDISDVVNSQGQWAIFRCDREAAAADLSDKKTVDEIRSYISTYQKGRIETFFETAAKDFTAKARGTSLTEAAAGARLQVLETDFFPFNLDQISFLKTIPPLADNAGSLSDAQNDPAFFKQAWSLKKGSISEPVLLGGKVIVLELLEERDAPQEEFETIKGQFKQFHEQYFGDFLFIIVDHLYTAGSPIFYSDQYQEEIAPYLYHQIVTSESPELKQYYLSQIVYNPNGLFPPGRRQDWPQFYLAFVDEEKAGTSVEQEERLNKGLEAFRALLSK